MRLVIKLACHAEESHADNADYIRIADEIIGRRPSEEVPAGGQAALDRRARRGLCSVSPSTIKQVYVRLEALRVIRRHQGKGIFVNDPKTWMRE